MTFERQAFCLDEVYDFRSGLSKPRSAFGSGYPFLTFKDVFYNTFVPRTLGDLVTSTQTERTNSDIRRGDVFLTRTSETQHELGMSCVALSDVPDGTFNGFTKRLRPKPHIEIIPEYAGYYFRSQDFRDRVSAISTLSTRASLNEAMLAHLQIVLPDLDTQRSVGTILKALDDKIASLREMNETLEEIARAVFRAWFVDFLPFRAKAAGSTSFRGMPQDLFDTLPVAFETSEVGEIPQGWRIDSLDSLVSQPIKRGLAPKYIDAGGVAVLNQRCIRDQEVDFGLARRHDNIRRPCGEKLVEIFDILVNCSTSFPCPSQWRSSLLRCSWRSRRTGARRMIWKHGRRLRGPELVTTAEFNEKLGKSKLLTTHLPDGIALINGLKLIRCAKIFLGASTKNLFSLP
jgi:hypothetical protein